MCPPRYHSVEAAIITSVVSGKPAFYAMDALASAGQRASLEGNKKFGLTRAAIFFC
jgi:hypothetical protein